MSAVKTSKGGHPAAKPDDGAGTAPTAASSSASVASTKLTGAKRDDKSKPSKPTEKPAAENPAAEKPAASDAATDDEKKTDAKTKKPRQQLTNVLDIDISQARCATHLKQNLTDKTIEGEVKELRKQLKEAKDGKKGVESEKEMKTVKDRIAELTNTQLRLSAVAPVAAATVADYMIKELLSHGMDQAIAEDKKMLEVSHLHQGDVKWLVTWPLIRKVKAFADYDPEHEEELRKERAEANKKAKQDREAKKESEKKVADKKKPAEGGAKSSADKKKPAEGGSKPSSKKSSADAGESSVKAAVDKKKPAEGGSKPSAKKPSAKEPSADTETDDENTEGGKTTFVTYVDNCVKSIRKDERYKNMRVSNRIREYGSDLVIGFLESLASMARILVQNVIEARTLNAGHIRAVVHILLANEDRTAEEIAPLLEQIDAKLKAYDDHVEAEKARKFESMTDEQKAKLEAKKRSQELERKKKSMENASKSAKKAAAKLAALHDELEAAGALADSNGDASAGDASAGDDSADPTGDASAGDASS
jgi:hypothetical protein